uniref:Peptidase A1 domain-containing protein n=1 Tax=Alexandrium monilatum TaxID=311494 RepID=A0A7S4T566_9DINO|mmetsp:Transcript_14195/g.42274  ORF Transcript_14195/g.42274 Transcript_14195/m.42274 type:complete len:493 (-) Transcript_14195:77-1555(-)
MPRVAAVALLFLTAVGAVPASADEAAPSDLEALATDDACALDSATCGLNALQLKRQRAAPSQAQLPGKTAALRFRRVKRAEQRRETDGHIHDGRLEGAAFADYAVQTTIGGQEFQVIVDTGSSTFAVSAAGGKYCPVHYDGPCTDHAIAAYYGSGNWSGLVCGGPQVKLAGLSAGTPVFAGIKEQNNFLTQCTGDNHGIISNGIVGMAYRELIEGFDGVPLFDSVVSASGIPNIFSMQCCGWKGGEAAGGQLVLGGVDSSLYTGDFQFTPITRHLWFCVEFEDIFVEDSSPPTPRPPPRTCSEQFPSIPCFLIQCGAVDAVCQDGFCTCPEGTCYDPDSVDCVPVSGVSLQQLGALRSEGKGRKGAYMPDCPAIIDSGTSEIVLTTDLYQSVMHSIQSAATEVLSPGAECVGEDDLDSFPNVIIKLGGGVRLSVPPTTYFQPSPVRPGCYLLFIGKTEHAPSIIGQPLMEAYYTVFDKENDRIGFAPIAGCN